MEVTELLKPFTIVNTFDAKANGHAIVDLLQPNALYVCIIIKEDWLWMYLARPSLSSTSWIAMMMPAAIFVRCSRAIFTIALHIQSNCYDTRPVPPSHRIDCGCCQDSKYYRKTTATRDEDGQKGFEKPITSRSMATTIKLLMFYYMAQLHNGIYQVRWIPYISIA